MANPLPDGRQFGHILLTPMDGWALRELIKPMDPGLGTKEAQLEFVKPLYEAMLRLIVADLPNINLPLSAEEALIINQAVKSGAYEGADALLLQTWQVLHEHTYDAPFVPPPGSVNLMVWPVTEEEEDAVHLPERPGRAESSRKASSNRRRTKLPAHAPSGGVSELEGEVV